MSSKSLNDPVYLQEGDVGERIRKRSALLRTKAPNHELLKYLPFDGHPGFNNLAIRKDFFNRFGGPEAIQDWNVALLAFEAALCEACENPEKVIVVNRKPVHKAAAMTAANHRHSI